MTDRAGVPRRSQTGTAAADASMARTKPFCDKRMKGSARRYASRLVCGLLPGPLTDWTFGDFDFTDRAMLASARF